MRTLALVPARGGSNGIPGKNVREFGGKPLISRAIEVGQDTCDEVWVTTDSAEISDVARRSGRAREGYEYGPDRLLHVFRPRALAADDTPMLAVVQHALKYHLAAQANPPYGVIVLLQPTQPFRKPEHVRAALKLLEENPGASSVVSVAEIPAHYSPDYAVRIEGETLMPFGAPPPCYMTTGDYSDEQYGELGSALRARQIDSMVTRRQDSRSAYSRDGTVYAIRRETIEAGSLYGPHCLPLIIPRSESVNLDTEEDWQEAERRLKA